MNIKIIENSHVKIQMSVILLGIIVSLISPTVTHCQRASLTQATTVAKVFIAAERNWSLGRGPRLQGTSEESIQRDINDWARRVTEIDTVGEVSLMPEAEAWENDFFVFSAHPRMFHALPIVVAVSRSSLKVYKLSGFSESDFNDLVSAHIQPVDSRDEAANLALFAEVVQRGRITQGVSDSTTLRCSDDREIEAGSVSVDTITSIIFNNNAPRDVYGGDDGKFVVHIYRVIVSQGVGTVHLISYVVGSNGILDRTAIFWCNIDLNARQR